MRVLSLFDGISCGKVALERAGIKVDKYYASEVDKYAIAIAAKNHPDITHIGDVRNVDFTDYIGKIDLIIGGSPCQDLSIAKNNRVGLEGERSSLFWRYVEAINTIKPKYFLYENVASMPKESKRIITEALGVEPVEVNSALLSAQNRRRFYWTSLPNVELPEDKGILLQDILIDGVSTELKSYCIPATYYKENCKSLLKRKKKGLYVQTEEGVRKFMPLECERLQTLPEGYTDGISNTQRYKCIGNAWTVDVIVHILKGLK